MQAIVLAGGKGSRLRPLTTHTPKPVVPIANRPFLLYQIELLKRADIRDIIMSLSYQPQKIEDKIGDGADYDARISYIVEATPLGTAGAYRNADSFMRETAVVLNGDVLTDIDLNAVIKFHRANNALATIVLAPVPNPADYGLVELGQDSRVLRFMEKPKPEEVTSNTINAGIYVLEPRVLDFIPDAEPFTFEYGLFPRLVELGEPVFGYVWPGYWRDIGAPASYLQANLDVLAGKVKLLGKPVQERGERFDPSCDIDQISVVDPSCTIKPGVEIINSVISRNCYVEERARIENSVVRGSSRIGTAADVRDSVVGKGCHIGRSVSVTGAVLGDKSVLTDYSQIR
jgi:NDP-sugar pyrophosphorylase family protein